MKRKILILALGALVACGGLSAADLAGLNDAAKLTAMGYSHQEAGTPGAALDRGAYCAVAGVLRRNLGEAGTADAGIACAP
jgi:hypothetical protein